MTNGAHLDHRTNLARFQPNPLCPRPAANLLRRVGRRRRFAAGRGQRGLGWKRARLVRWSRWAPFVIHKYTPGGMPLIASVDRETPAISPEALRTKLGSVQDGSMSRTQGEETGPVDDMPSDAEMRIVQSQIV